MARIGVEQPFPNPAKRSAQRTRAAAERVADAVRKVQASPDFQARLAALGYSAWSGSGGHRLSLMSGHGLSAGQCR